jgi:ABC-type transporter Mla subunit MlaD
VGRLGIGGTVCPLRTPSHLIQTTSPLRRFHRVVIMAVMADKDGKATPRTGTERIRKLAQAALNADVTVDQVDTILVGLGETLIDLNNSTENLDATLVRFNETINHINELAPRLNAMVDRLEAIVDRVERIVGLGEAAVAPLAATESAVRGVVNKVRRSTGL